MSDDDCGKFFKNVRYTSSNICAGSGRLSTSACHGDSGGPLFCNDEFNRHIQVGITSYVGKICGLPNIPTVFTRVSDVAQWIDLNS